MSERATSPTSLGMGSGFVNFISSDGVDPDESSFFFLDTEATNYAAIGSYDLLCAPSGCVSPPFDTFAPTAVPEPGTIGLLALGVAFAVRHRRRSGR